MRGRAGAGRVAAACREPLPRWLAARSSAGCRTPLKTRCAARSFGWTAGFVESGAARGVGRDGEVDGGVDGLAATGGAVGGTGRVVLGAGTRPRATSGSIREVGAIEARKRGAVAAFR